MHCCFTRFLTLVIGLSSLGSAANATDFHVYYLGGQSNMDGYGYVDKLSGELAKPVDGVPIFHGNTSKDDQPIDGKGIWSTLKPGHGVGFTPDGQANHYSKRFGVELSFARTIRKKFPERRIAVIKYSRGGTSIAEAAAGDFGCWEPDFKGKQGINQYDHFLASVRNAYSDVDIDDDGSPDRLIPAGIVWMQGESDAAATPEVARMYQANLRRLMDLIRATFRADDIPVVIGRISYSKKEPLIWPHGELVRSAQAAFVADDSNASIVTTTDDYGYSDPWHYDSDGYIDLGEQFAKAMTKLEGAKAE